MINRISFFGLLLVVSYSLSGQKCKLDKSRMRFVEKVSGVLLSRNIKIDEQLQFQGIEADKGEISKEIDKVLRTHSKERRKCELIFASFISDVEDYLSQIEVVQSKLKVLRTTDVESIEGFWQWDININAMQTQQSDTISKFLRKAIEQYENTRNQVRKDQLKLVQLILRNDSSRQAKDLVNRNFRALMDLEIALLKERVKSESKTKHQIQELFEEITTRRMELLRESNRLQAIFKARS